MMTSLNTDRIMQGLKIRKSTKGEQRIQMLLTIIRPKMFLKSCRIILSYID